MKKRNNSHLNEGYPCLIVKRSNREDEYCDLRGAAVILGRSMNDIYDMLESCRGHLRTTSFEVHVEDDVSRVRRAKKKEQEDANRKEELENVTLNANFPYLTIYRDNDTNEGRECNLRGAANIVRLPMKQVAEALTNGSGVATLNGFVICQSKSG